MLVPVDMHKDINEVTDRQLSIVRRLADDNPGELPLCDECSVLVKDIGREREQRVTDGPAVAIGQFERKKYRRSIDVV